MECDRHRALVRVHRVRRIVLHPDHGIRPAVRPDVRAAGDRPLGGLRVGQRADRLGWADLHRVLDDHPGCQGHLARVQVLRVAHLAGGLCRADHPRHRLVRLVPPRDGVSAARCGDQSLALPVHLVPAAAGHRGVRPGDRDRDAGGREDRHLDGLVRRARAEPDHGGCLAPVHGLAEHLVQARGIRQARARRPAAHRRRRQVGGLRRDRGPRRRRQPRASASSRTSPGRACWTSPAAPSAAGARASARRGTRRSRCHRSC